MMTLPVTLHALSEIFIRVMPAQRTSCQTNMSVRNNNNKPAAVTLTMMKSPYFNHVTLFEQAENLNENLLTIKPLAATSEITSSSCYPMTLEARNSFRTNTGKVSFLPKFAKKKNESLMDRS